MQDVQQPYLTCETTFSGKVSQAVFTKKRDTSAVCTLVPPEMNGSDTKATVKITSRPPPGKPPELNLQHSIHFIRPPTIRHVLLACTAERGEFIEVTLDQAAALRKVNLLPLSW